MRLWHWRAGFFAAVGLVAAAAAYILWAEVRAAEDTRAVMSKALDRAANIAQMRRDAQALESAVEAHLRATNAEQRAAAGEVMGTILSSLQRTRRDVLEQRAVKDAVQLSLWAEFDALSSELARRVREMTSQDPPEDERERAALLAELQPMLARLDAQAAALAHANAAESPRVLERVDARRLGVVQWGLAALAGAMLLASLLGAAMTGLLNRQDRTIRRQLAELDARNQELDAFAGRVAHDLVNPLTPLKGHLTMASRTSGAKSDPTLLEHLHHAQASAGRMASLVEALLKFCRAGSRVEAPGAALDGVVASQLLEAAQVAQASAVELQRELSTDVVVTLPGALLHTVAQNLISNALKYTTGREGARVTVRVRGEPGWGVLEVEDNGPGISAEALPRLFQPFFRARETQALAGHGLGLATVKRVVEAYGGAIELDTEAGRGTRVRVRLPRVTAQGTSYVTSSAAPPSSANPSVKSL